MEVLRIPRLLGAAILVALVACGDIEDVGDPVASATATGTVTDTSGIAIQSALVRGSPCSQPTFDHWITTTGSSGRYALRMSLFPSLGDTICVGFVVDPPPDSAFASDTVFVNDISFSAAAGVPGDSIQLDFVLEPGA